MTVPLLANSV